MSATLGLGLGLVGFFAGWVAGQATALRHARRTAKDRAAMRDAADRHLRASHGGPMGPRADA
jgi:hypothetical protein